MLLHSSSDWLRAGRAAVERRPHARQERFPQGGCQVEQCFIMENSVSIPVSLE